MRDLAGQRIYLDTTVIIHAVETPTPLSKGQLALFDALDEGAIEAVTSELTLAECLVYPLAAKDSKLAAIYEKFLSGATELELVPISRQILLAAAHIRALKRLKLPDAIHVATAMSARATVLMTADRRIRVSRGLRVEKWQEL